MIKNFESYTQPLSDLEKKWINVMIEVFKTKAYRKDHWLSSNNLVKALNAQYEITYDQIKFITPVTVRKLVNFLCVNKIMPIASSEAGYWLCGPEDFKDQIESLVNRSNAIISRAEGLAHMSINGYEAQ